MEGPRLQILNLLQRHGRATVEQISREVDLAAATVRRHLDILQRDHLVTYRQVKKKTGRPEYTYYLTEAGQEQLPKDYSTLLGRLLQEMAALSPEEVGNRDGKELVKLLYQRMARKTVTRAEVGSPESLQQRVATALAVLSQEKFEPEVQQSDGSLRFLLHNCPFRSVALEDDSVCEYDGLVLSGILGVEVTQENCISNKDGACCYRVSAVSPVQ